jgi:type II secretory pathway pseudopilin PulG
MRPFPKTSFSLAEVLIVIAIVVVLGAVSTPFLIGRVATTDLGVTAQQMITLSREAQSRSASQDSNAQWGIHFENATQTAPFYALFRGSYASTTAIGHYRLPADVGYVTSSIARGANKEIIFAKISGLPATSTAIQIYQISNPNNSSTISISANGVADWTISSPISQGGGSTSSSSSGGSYTFKKDTTLSPGTYGDIVVSGGCTLTLYPGIYNLNSLTLSGGSVVFWTGGLVTMNMAGVGVSSVVDLSGGSLHNRSRDSDLLQLNYNGSGNIDLSGGSMSYGHLDADNATLIEGGGSAWCGTSRVGHSDISGNRPQC